MADTAALRMGVIPKSTKSITCKGILNRGHTCAETHPFCQKTCGSCLQLYECSDNEIGLLVEDQCGATRTLLFVSDAYPAF